MLSTNQPVNLLNINCLIVRFMTAILDIPVIHAIALICQMDGSRCKLPDESIWLDLRLLFGFNFEDFLCIADCGIQAHHVGRLIVLGEEGELLLIVQKANLLQVFQTIEIFGVMEIFEQKVEMQTSKLRQINQGLQQEIAKRQQTEEALRQAQNELEKRVTERTTQLKQTNTLLQQAIATRKQVEEYMYLQANILSQVTDAIIAIDPRRRIIYWNQGAERLYNLQADEVINCRLEEALEYSWFKQEDKQTANEALATIGSWQGENIHIKKSGEIIYVDSSICVIKEENGNAIGLLAVVRDISDRKRTEIALRESQERLQLVLGGSKDGIWDWNLQTDEVFFSPRWKEMRGFYEHEIGNSLDEWSRGIHPDDVSWVMEALQNYFDHKTPFFAAEYRVRHKDGSYIWVLEKGQALWDEAGNVLRMAASETDISDRKLSEQKIRQQAALLDITTDAILVQDLTSQILFWNKGAERLYGWCKQEALENNAYQLLYDDETLPQLKAAIKNVLEKGEWYGELNQVTKAGKNIIVEGRWTLIRDETGKPKSILAVATDITEKKQLETQFLRAQRLESIGTLASGIAHDLNNILTPILAATQLLPIKLTNIDERSQDLLKILAENSKRGIDLVKQILSFARGAEGKRTILQVGHLLVEIARIARQTFPKSIEICMDFSTKELWTVSADATQLHQVFMNLCVNARDAMLNGGNLIIAAENLFVDENYARMHLDAHVGPYVVITVSDSGIGIPTELLERIFEPFFTTKETGHGTGLGLYTVLGIIKNHGGFINVYSEVSGGTRFKVYLPAVEGCIAQSVQDLEPCAGNGELILVVDDEVSIQKITKTSLETYNYKALLASDGIEAIALFAEHKREIKAVLLDLMMPSLDTLTTIRTLYKLNPEVPIIAMSGLASNEVVTKAASTGVQAFLAKPFTAWELLNTLQKAIAAETSLSTLVRVDC
jgi:PAS domain S-box-containing protein